MSQTKLLLIIVTYMEDALDYLELKNQPIVVEAPQYEQNLYMKEPYISLAYTTSPRVYTTGQELLDKITPFPPDLDCWYDVGDDWVDGSAGMETIHGGIVASRAVHLLQEKVSPFFPTWAHLDPFIKDYG